MSPFHPLPMFSYHSTPSLFDDVEMLQTDVMRFFAVLCLCLMAIFALVKTLPMAPPAAGPALARPADRKAEAVMLQKKIAALKGKLDEMQIRLKASAAAAEYASARAIKATQTEEAARDRVDIVKKPPRGTPTAEPIQRGFTLRFASDEVLNRLISNEKVKFYAIAGKKAWRLKLSGERPVYIAAEFPRQIYEMETPTVPTDYAAVFQRQIAAFGRRTLIWGVTLPGRTADSIHQMITGREGGELIIMADGEVKLN